MSYHPFGVELDPGVEIYVSVYGHVIACNLPELNALVGASPEERETRINSLVEKMKSKKEGE